MKLSSRKPLERRKDGKGREGDIKGQATKNLAVIGLMGGEKTRNHKKKGLSQTKRRRKMELLSHPINDMVYQREGKSEHSVSAVTFKITRKMKEESQGGLKVDGGRHPMEKELKRRSIEVDQKFIKTKHNLPTTYPKR